MGTYFPGTETLGWGAWCGAGTPHSWEFPPEFLFTTHGCRTSPFHISTPPTSLNVCGFFNSIVVRLLFNLISEGSEGWLFHILAVISCGCVRRWVISAYDTIFTRSYCGFDCIFLMISDVWAPFHALWPPVYVFFGKMSIQILCQSFNQIICDIELYNYMNFLYILNINPLGDIWFTKILFHSIGCLLILLMVSFAVWSILVWCSSTYFCFYCFCFFGIKSKKSFPKLMSRSLPPRFSCRSLIHFELIFV